MTTVYEKELYHHGVLGQKWGVRRYQNADGSYKAGAKGRYDDSDTSSKSAAGAKFKSAKANYKQANKEYNKSFNKAANGFQLGRKAKERWADAADKALKAEDAKQEYKAAKKERKAAIKDTYKEFQEKATLGEKLMWNDATRKKAAKYVVDHNMSMEEANKKAIGDAKRNTAIILGAYGALTMAALYANSKI